MSAKEVLRSIGQGCSHSMSGISYYSKEELQLAAKERREELRTFILDRGYTLEDVKRMFNEEKKAQQE